MFYLFWLCIILKHGGAADPKAICDIRPFGCDLYCPYGYQYDDSKACLCKCQYPCKVSTVCLTVERTC
ncbi:unnamed protein product [Soboliphyme baturini]|uniref:Antistasin-like domain-containing protein n=1 Tax=Soboliphyme baturini TaxID=241478 RepID=A0A183J8N2_9BILA|nr:unnamed protein product [Soboliphyme baturini]